MKDMESEKQICNSELAKKLNELGIQHAALSAFTANELREILPRRGVYTTKLTWGWLGEYAGRKVKIIGLRNALYAKTEADVLAELLIRLIEFNVVQL